MSSWKLTIKKDILPSSPVFVEGLPGIGNVGKIAIDYIIEQTKAKCVATLFSTSLPNSVFVTENNLVQLPKIELYHARVNNIDFLFLSGDTQPSEEMASYDLTQTILSLLHDYGVREILTTGGIGLEQLPDISTVYVTGNNSDFVDTIPGGNREIYGVVGPIVGVSGLLLGLADSIPAAALLVETLAHPMHVGLSEAKELIKILDDKYCLSISYSDLDEEISAVKKTGKRFAKSVTYPGETQYIG